MTDRPLPRTRELYRRRLVLVSALVLGMILLVRLVIDRGITRADRAFDDDRRARAQAFVEREVRALSQLADEYGGWDETGAVLLDPTAAGSQSWFLYNFAQWFPRYGVRAVQLADAEGTARLEWEDPSVGPGFASAVARRARRGLPPDEASAGFVGVGSSLALVASAPVWHPDTSRGPIGRLLLVVPVSDSLLGAWSEAVRHDIARRDSPRPPDTEEAAIVLPWLDEGTGAPLVVRAAPDDLDVLVQDSRLATPATFVLVLLVTALTWGLLSRGMVRPLERTAAQLSTTQGVMELVLDAKTQEWAAFRDAFNAAVRSLRSSEQRYQQLFQQSATPLLLLDETGEAVVDANAQAEGMLALTRTELLEAGLPAAWQPPADGQPLRVRRADGSTRSFDCAVSVLEVQGCRLRLVAYRDVTDAEALARAQKLEAVNSLASGIAHDFNNLMAAILAGTSAARAGERGHDVARTLDTVDLAARRASELTRQLLTLASPSLGRRTLVDARLALENVARLAIRTFPASLRLVIDAPEPVPAVMANAAELEQAILNLALNARDAMPNGGVVTLRAASRRLESPTGSGTGILAKGTYVVIGVEDHGIGIPAELRERVFEPFFTTKPRGQGTGLGLAMVMGSMQRLRGGVRLESTPGAGTRVELWIPATSTRVPSEPATVPDRPVVRDGTLVVLVDDEPELRESVAEVLRLAGFTVRACADGETAVTEVAREPGAVSIVLLDVQMPGMSGPETLRALRALDPQLPVLLFSGYVDAVTRAALADVPMVELLEKPVEIPVLVRRLAALARAPVGAAS